MFINKNLAIFMPLNESHLFDNRESQSGIKLKFNAQTHFYTACDMYYIDIVIFKILFLNTFNFKTMI